MQHIDLSQEETYHTVPKPYVYKGSD